MLSLEEQEQAIQSCHKCPLSETRNNIVFGSGNPHARVVIVGEAPGRNEDLKGYPFVGAAGKKLEGYLELAGLTRDEIYIANVVKCRPPSNRNPHVGEIEACAPYLRDQIRAIRPDVIVCLGNFATRFILHTDKGISELRGQFLCTGPFQVFPTYHPAAAIYRKEWQAIIEEDFRRLGSWLVEHPCEVQR